MAEVAGDRSGRRPLFPPEMQETGDIGAHLVGHGVEPGDVEGLWAVNVHASDAAAGVDDPGKHHAGNLAPAVGFGHRPCRAAQPLAQRIDAFKDALALAGERSDEPLSPAAALERSEEHTSELQSLMSITYSVYCLKQKKKTHND